MGQVRKADHESFRVPGKGSQIWGDTVAYVGKRIQFLNSLKTFKLDMTVI